MKRIFIIAISALSLTLFSFVAPTGNGVTKVGEALYNVSGARFTESEKAIILKAFTEKCGIVNLNNCPGGKVTVTPLAKSTGANWILDREVGMDFVDTKFINYDNATVVYSDPTISAVNRILANYASRP